MVWYSHLFKNLPQFVVIHTFKGFGIVNKAEIDVSLELSHFFDDSADVGNLISGSSAFSKSSLSARFGSTYTKIGTIQRRLAWPLRKDDTQIREAFHIFKKINK